MRTIADKHLVVSLKGILCHYLIAGSLRIQASSHLHKQRFDQIISLVINM